MRMFQVDAFTAELFSGNPAGVLILDDWLDEPLMQSIALENNLAETAFACPTGDGTWDLRWFTPAVEVDFCGHATLATAHVLASEYGARGTMTFRTRVGELRVNSVDTGYVLDVPKLAPQDLSIAEEQQIRAALPMLPANGPLFCNAKRNIYAVLPDAAAVLDFRPDFAALKALPFEGLVVTAPGEATDFVSRYFAPAAGLDEDPVTGSTHATLMPYWSGILGSDRLVGAQLSARGGQIVCRASGDRVLLEGQAITYMDAQLKLPF